MTVEVGYPCPNCGERTVVTDTRQREGTIRRRRRCPICTFRFGTDEVVRQREATPLEIFESEVLPLLTELEEKIARIRAAFDERESLDQITKT